MTDPTPRIMLIHALRESQVPAWRAFEAGWPQARIFNLLDDSLSADVAAAGRLTDDMIERFLTLGRYAAGTGADAIQFTCSAFGPAIERWLSRLPYLGAPRAKMKLADELRLQQMRFSQSSPAPRFAEATP